MKKRAAALVVLAVISMAHVGSPDTFFTGKAGPYDVRVSVRLPGVIPGRAQVAVRIVNGAASASPTPYAVTVQAAQWNLGLKGAPPPDHAVAVAGDPSLFAAELWFMTATSYQLSVVVDGPSGRGTALVPVMAIATAQRPMPPWLGGVLAALGVFLTVGMLSIIGTAVRESVLPPGAQPDATRRTRGRIGMAVTAAFLALALWGGNKWWAAEASAYGRLVMYRPFTSEATINGRMLTLSIDDARWTGTPVAASRYNALLPDHGKLMHLFLVGEGTTMPLAHVHPVARSPQALQFDVVVPPVPAGHYRVYADIVHESGYAQTLVAETDVPHAADSSGPLADADDSWFAGQPVQESAVARFPLADGAQVVWERGPAPLKSGDERVLTFSVRDAADRLVPIQPYMGMAAHLVVANADGSVFAHLHPSGSISMAALQKFAADAPAAAQNADAPHAGHAMSDATEDSRVAIPFAFPKAGSYSVWVQVKRDGRVETAAFAATVQ